MLRVDQRPCGCAGILSVSMLLPITLHIGQIFALGRDCMLVQFFVAGLTFMNEIASYRDWALSPLPQAFISTKSKSDCSPKVLLT